MARRPQAYECRGYEFTVYRSGFSGRIEIDLTGTVLGYTMICRYTTRENDAGPKVTYMRTHERAVGYALGIIRGLLTADAIDDASAPKLVLLDGGLS